jgi:hypothetical protein
MPIRTITQDLCDICYSDTSDSVEATNKLRFAWQNKPYILLTCDRHAVEIADEFSKLTKLGSPETKPHTLNATKNHGHHLGSGRNKSALSSLSETEKNKFRLWANMPNARRISDQRVYEWIRLGKP